MTQKRILIVDDDPVITQIMAEALHWEGFHTTSCISARQAKKNLTDHRFDLVILDLNLSDSENGFDLLEFAKGNSPFFVSVIFVSAAGDTETVVNGLDRGADDYIVKPFSPAEFLARVRAQLRIKDLTDRLQQANLKLQELVEIDDLTGLFNMRSIYQKIEHEILRAQRYQRFVCVVMLDMDYFKTVNDGHDHLFGSFVLSEVGKIIRHSIRNIDIAARYGGDEFLIVLTETNLDGALSFCERLRQSIKQFPFENGNDQIRLTASLGFAITMPTDSKIDAHALVREADHALYEAKNKGRNQVCHKVIGELPHLDIVPIAPARKKGA